MRILFVTSNRIGDAVLSTGLLDHLLRSHPEARFTVACGPAAAGVFTRLPRLERLIAFEKRTYARHWFDLWRQVVGTRWDLVVDIRGSALAWTLRAHRRAVMHNTHGHKTRQLAAVLHLDPPPLPVAWTGPEDRARAEALLGEGRWIALGPTANTDLKIWPAERFIELYRALAAGPLAGARAVVLGGPDPRERPLAQPVIDALSRDGGPGSLDLCGKLSLAESAAVLARCAFFAGNDSGLMHLAAAAGAPTLGVFGPTPWQEYSPAGRHTAVAVSPTGRMADLTVPMALEAAGRLLEAAR